MSSRFPHEPELDLGHMVRVTDFKTLYDSFMQRLTGKGVDDKTYFMEHLIREVAKAPDSPISQTISQVFVTRLWNDLQHPPQSSLGHKFRYRQADGSFNSLKHPELGQAGMPYARTVQPKTFQPVARPDPGVIFDSIMARKKSEKHPSKISSMLFYLGSIIIHDLFHTDHVEWDTSKTSSYLDLAPLYGSNAEELKTMRTFKNGRLKPDCFSETRVLLFPPGVPVLLIMFNRFHNYVAGQLADINESNRFPKPVDPHSKMWEKYDEDLFQTARLITCGLYINCIVNDYLRTILNLTKTDSNWSLDPRGEIKGPTKRLAKGVGNQVSVEFNLVYRWHAVISHRDEKWTEEVWKELFPGEDPNKIDTGTFLRRVSMIEKQLPKEPEKRPFNKMQRKADGTFDDEELVNIVADSIEDCANSFGARRMPAVLRVVEVLGIQQARAWNCATLNEFRKFFNLAPHRTFEDINPEIADQLKHLYDNPDLVELYPGLVVESTKEPTTPGSGFATNFTISRAILSDAVALVRGDRFYTIDFHPMALTNWGYKLIDSDKAVDNGCVMYKLFMRAFPNHFRPRSVYAHYPFTIPSEMQRVLKSLYKAHLYDFERPKYIGHPKIICSYECAEKVLGAKETFHVTWGPTVEFLLGDPAKNFMLAGDGDENVRLRMMLSEALYVDQWHLEVKKYYVAKSEEILKKKSYKLGDNLNQVDIIRDVSNLVHVHFVADLFLLPLKTEKNPHGTFTEHELYTTLALFFASVFFDLDAGLSFPLQQKAYKATRLLGDLVESKVREIRAGRGILSADNGLERFGPHLIRRLLATRLETHELVWGHIMGAVGSTAPKLGQVFGQVIEFFLATEQGRALLPECRELALRDDDESFDKLMHYFMEGSRLGGGTDVFRRATKSAALRDGDRELEFQAGDELVVHLPAVSRDQSAFPDPHKVDITRPLEAYVHLGDGEHQWRLGLPMMRVALTTLFKVVLKECPGLRVANGPQGTIRKVQKTYGPPDEERPEVRCHWYLTEMNDSLFPFPQSLKVNWD